MRRQNAFAEDRDAESISDEDEFDRVVYDHDCLENLRPLCRRGNMEERQVLSQLERLEGEQLPSNSTCQLIAGDRKTTASLEKLEKFSAEDEIELETCYIHNEEEFLQTCRRDGAGRCNNEALSDDVKETDDKVISSFSFKPVAAESHEKHPHDFEYDKQDVSCTWSAFLKDAEELVSLHEDDNSSSHAAKSEVGKFQKGCGVKTKHKFSIHLPSKKDELSWSSMLKYEIAKSSEVSQISLGLEAVEHTVADHSMAVLLEHLQEENEKSPEASKLPGRLALEHRGTEHSMAEILEGLQEKNGSLGESHSVNGNMKERRFQHAEKKALTSLGNRSLDNEDPLENMDCQKSSEDEDGNQNHLSLQIPNIKQQTMLDRFQQTFNPAALDGEGAFFPINKNLGSGFYGRLQQVMQKEKHRHAEFLKQFQTGTDPNDESGCINVQLLSRHLDAKLTVCRCKLLGNIECPRSPQKLVDGGTYVERVIVFSPRVCNDVELEVGNTIRVHPPWKEVHVAENEIVILCTYFSQFSS